jgi:hypothetical protein
VPPADLAGLSVPLAGSLEQTSDPWLPYRMIDPAGVPVEAVSAFFGDLQAAGRSEATARSYGMDLLRWFRFLWAIQVPWHQATRTEGPGLLPLDAGGGQAVPPALAQPGAGGRGQHGEREAIRAVGACPLRDRAALFLCVPPGSRQRADRQSVPAGSHAAGRAGARAPQPDVAT